jgi:hypothetical protein
MQADITNWGEAKLSEAKMFWNLFTDMDNQYVTSFDVFPPARVVEREERNMIAIINVPELSPGESFSPTVMIRTDTTTLDWMIEPHDTPESDMLENRQLFCSSKKFWDLDDQTVQDISHSVAEQSSNDESYARIALQIVGEMVKSRKHLEHRIGAAKAVRESEGDCDEYADLYISLMRIVKIPARRVVGHIFKGQSEPEPHAWTEIYLENKGWIPVDPALETFGVLSEKYFSRIREGLISERPTIQLKWQRDSSEMPVIQESVRMTVLRNNHS